ncbi:tyrosine-protein phosphatase [Nonomuraea sp. NPDC049309]|uniref:tyrosine-protein phosphatase n=1 Tax=Nonomuraea sp. NPDC049309 TaxID=3364350 RepID=UPI003714CFE5
MRDERHVDWEGCFNARDLGGLPVRGGGVIRTGALIRSDSPERLTQEGWRALVDHGVRTIIDLRNEDERRGDAHPRPEVLTTVHVPLDDSADTAFWNEIWENELDGSPLYYRIFIERKARLCADAVAAIARARSGGVLVHCGLGRDRTGLIVMLVLALAGVAPEDIADDYELSTARLPRLFRALGIADQTEEIQRILARKGTTVRDALLDALDGLDVEKHLRAAGLTDGDVAELRARLIGTSGS